MLLGIRSHDLKIDNFLTESQLADRVEECGLDGLQLTCFKTFEDIKQQPGSMDADRAKKITSVISKKGKRIFLLAAYFNPVHSDRQKTQRCIQVFKEYLKLSKDFGANVVASETGSYNDDLWTYNPKNRTKEALAKVIDTFKDLAQAAKGYGVKAGIEGAAGHVCFNVNTLKQAVQEIGTDNLTVIFDIYNFLEIDNCHNYMAIVEEGLKAFEGNIHCFHMKDFAVLDGKLKQTPIGRGQLDYRAFLKAIKDYDKNAILILEGATGDNIIPSANYIKDIWHSV